VSIRPGWFHRPEEDDRVRSVDDLVDLFFASVGRNSKLLLNVPPTAAGLLPETDATRLRGMDEALGSIFARDLADGAPRTASTIRERSVSVGIDLGRTSRIAVSDLREDIHRGQSVVGYRLEGLVDGEWRVLVRGGTIGYRKLDRFGPIAVRHLRLTVEDGWGQTGPIRFAVYADGSPEGGRR
jgi:alpha-L-fucosidase